jgi:hypothetical protein
VKALTHERDSAQVELSTQELVILSNALNEVCNGVRELDHDNEFHARLGVGRSEARKLLAQMHSLLGPIR